MDPLFLVLFILALLCFIAAAVGFAGRGVSLLAMGLFFWVLVDLIKLLARI